MASGSGQFESSDGPARLGIFVDYVDRGELKRDRWPNSFGKIGRSFIEVYLDFSLMFKVEKPKFEDLKLGNF